MYQRSLIATVTSTLALLALAAPPAVSATGERPAVSRSAGDLRPDPAAQAAAARDHLTVRWDVTTGLPRSVTARSGVLAPASGDHADALLTWLRAHRDTYGLSAADLAGVRLEHAVTVRGGASYVYLQQYDGARRVVDAGAIGVFNADDDLVAVTGRLLPAVHGRGNGLDATAATTAAGRALHLKATNEPVVKGQADDGTLRLSNPYATALRRPDRITAEPVTLRTRDGDRNAWQLSVEVDPVRYYDVVVDAATGAVLDKQNRYDFDSHGTVWTSQNPTTTRVQVPFTGWVADRATAGNNANVYEDRNGDNASDYQTQTPASGDPNYQHFDYPFTNAWQTNADGTAASLDADRDAVLTQLFYWVNWTHDRLYGLGFDEQSRNFQSDNFGRGGTGGDAVQAEAFDGFNNGSACNANFSTGADGSTARLQVFVGNGSKTNCPYALSEIEGDTVVHEYGHGVFRRLVNGGNGVGSGVQLGGMNEGNSDTIAASFFNDPVLFEYDSGNASTGLRRVRYDTSTWTYSSVCNAGCEVHNDGEIWATATWDLRELMTTKYGNANRFERLILDGLRATPSSADFLDGRDGILSADAGGGAADKCLIWGAFIRTGMGLSASTTANQQTVTEARDVPTECRPTANAGGPYTTPEGTDVTLSASGSTKGTDPSAGAIASYAWDLDNDGQYDDATGASTTFSDVGDNGSHTVGVQVTDAYGVTATASTTVTVTNVAPTVAVASITAADEGSAITLTGSVSDPGWQDVLTATVDWGDGSGAHVLSGTAENDRPDATLTFNTQHTYGDNGAFTVTVCAGDDDAGVGCDAKVAVIGNVAPTAAVDTSAASSVQGVLTIFAHAGDTVPFSGRSTDPGSDDLTLTWDWGDGGASPDESRTSLVNPPDPDPALSPSVQPRDVTDTTSHVFTGACLYTVTFAAADDDGGTASSHVAVVITGNADSTRSAGYWYSQMSLPGNRSGDYTPAERACLLAIVGHFSAVFDEVRDASTSALAAKLLKTSKSSTARDLLAAQLLAAWLNLASGALDPGELVDTDGNGLVDSTFLAAVTAAEDVYLDVNATRAQLIEQKTILERINRRDE